VATLPLSAKIEPIRAQHRRSVLPVNFPLWIPSKPSGLGDSLVPIRRLHPQRSVNTVSVEGEVALHADFQTPAIPAVQVDQPQQNGLPTSAPERSTTQKSACAFGFAGPSADVSVEVTVAFISYALLCVKSGFEMLDDSGRGTIQFVGRGNSYFVVFRPENHSRPRINQKNGSMICFA
jgi:hypothetical protein